MKLAIALQVGNGNPGDSIAAYSCKGLISAIEPGIMFDTWALREDPPFNYANYRFPDYSLSVISCTPWMWQAAGRSRKYAILSDYLTSVTAGKRIAFGIGSAYNLDHNRPEETFSGEMETQTTHEVWSKVDKIVCRDRLAHLIFLNMFGPEKVDILPCPSFYSAQIFKVLPDAVEERLLVFCNVSPETQWGIQPEDVRIAMELQDKLVASNIPTLTMTDGDQESFQRRYGKMPSHNLRSPRAIIAAIAGYHSLISARVHACMPALSLGMEVDIIPLDSRALTAIHLGANAVAIDMKVMGRYKQSIEPIRLDQMLARTSALVSD